MYSIYRSTSSINKIRLLVFFLFSYVMVGCDQPPPTNEKIFVNPPTSTSFDTDEGIVILSALGDQSVCYSVNGDAPGYDNGKCSGDAELYESEITLSCQPNESGETVPKEIQLSFEWSTSTEITVIDRAALFFLNCDNPVIQIDSDKDGIPDVNDNCPLNVNEDQADQDNDGVGDICDFDIDNDGILDSVDNCPIDSNPDQADTDKDGLGNVCDFDADNDGVLDDTDNCPNAPNPEQTDGDSDGLGDECDSLFDTDKDGIEDAQDNCPLTPNDNQLDSDGDGDGDACDPEPYAGTEKFFYGYEDLLDRLIQEMQCAFNNCNAPTGRFNWTITPNNSALESGSANWKAVVKTFFPPTARTTFTANFALLDSCVGNGSASGVVNSSGTGDMQTSSPISFNCDGLSGLIEMNLKLTRGKVTGGFYDAFCVEESCEDTVVRFTVIGKQSDGTLIYKKEVRGNTLP